MITISNIDTNAMKAIEKHIAVEMKLIAINNDKNKKKFFTDVVTEEKLSYLRLIFLEDFFLSELEERKIKKLLLGYYINLKLNEDDDELYEIFYSAIRQNSSDIHIEPYEEYANIRYRIDGTLFITNKVDLRIYNKLVNRIKVLSNLDISKKLEPQDGKLKFNYNHKDYDIRISILPTITGEKLVLRVLYQNKELINLDNLTFNKNQRKAIDKLLSLNNGIVLVNGPTGSGKSTTLYAFVNYYDKESKNISTVEDPVEFSIPGIVQSNVNEKIGFSFSAGLRHLLRQDPDIILIGEIRDEETAKIAVRAAITGHKVLGTIHTNSARDVYLRLIDMGIEPYLLRQSLKGAVAQRLMRKLCPDCKEKIKVKNPIINDGEEVSVYKAKGCSNCNYSGYKGRVMVSEVVDFSEVDFDNLCENKNSELIKSAKEYMDKGEISIEDYLLFREGEVEIEN